MSRVSCSRTNGAEDSLMRSLLRSRMQQVDFEFSNAVLDESSLANKALSYKRIGLWQYSACYSYVTTCISPNLNLISAAPT